MSKVIIKGHNDRAKVSIDGWEPPIVELKLVMRVGNVPCLDIAIPITDSEVELDGVEVTAYPEGNDERETNSTGILPDRSDDRCSDNVSNNVNNNGEKK